MCWYVLVCTNLDLGSKMVQTRLEPAIFCILFICFIAALRENRHQRVQTPNTEYVTAEKFVYIDLPADVTCRLMSDVGAQAPQRSPPPAMTLQALASTWISKACEAGLGGPGVEAHSSPIEENWNSLQLGSERWPVAVQLTL
jgi:hypothetical protein